MATPEKKKAIKITKGTRSVTLTWKALGQMHGSLKDISAQKSTISFKTLIALRQNRITIEAASAELIEIQDKVNSLGKELQEHADARDEITKEIGSLNVQGSYDIPDKDKVSYNERQLANNIKYGYTELMDARRKELKEFNEYVEEDVPQKFVLKTIDKEDIWDTGIEWSGDLLEGIAPFLSGLDS